MKKNTVKRVILTVPGQNKNKMDKRFLFQLTENTKVEKAEEMHLHDKEEGLDVSIENKR